MLTEIMSNLVYLLKLYFLYFDETLHYTPYRTLTRLTKNKIRKKTNTCYKDIGMKIKKITI